MSAPMRVPPTRLALLRLRRRHRTLVGACELLERKRRVLAQRLSELAPRWHLQRTQAYEVLGAAYRSFGSTRMRSTASELRQVVGGMPALVTVAWRQRVVSGVRAFEEACEVAPIRPRFGLLGTTAELDRTIALFSDVVSALAALAAIETTARSLVGALEKTNRQVRTLRDRLIPAHETTIRWITETLDEQERGYLFQIKRLGHRHE